MNWLELAYKFPAPRNREGAPCCQILSSVFAYPYCYRCRPAQRAKQASTTNSPIKPVASVRQISCPRTASDGSLTVPIGDHFRLERAPQTA